MKTQALNKIEQGRRLLGLDMVVRTPSGEAATENNTPLIQLYQLHRTTLVHNNNRVARTAQTSDSIGGGSGPSSGPGGLNSSGGVNSGLSAAAQANTAATILARNAGGASAPGSPGTVRGRSSLSLSASAISAGGPQSDAPRPPSRHLIINMKGFICNVNDETELYFYLAHHPTNKPAVVLTDHFQVILTARGMVVDTTRVDNMKTVFKDLPPMLPLNEIYLCCKVVRKGGMTMKESLIVTQAKAKEKEKSSKGSDANDLRRPFGLAVINVGSAGIKRGKEVENMMPIYRHAKDENQYWALFDLIQRKSRDVEEVPKSKGISIGLNMLTGSWEDHLASNRDLTTIPVTMPLSIGEDEPAGFQRNDIFITLKDADFAGASHSAEVVTEVRDANGVAVPNCLLLGTSYNPFPQTRLRSTIYHKCSTPQWDESFLLRLPPSSFVPGLHIYLTFRSIGSEKKEKAEGFAFAKIDLVSPQTGTVVRDGLHTVTLIKPPKGLDWKKEANWYLRPQADLAALKSASSTNLKEKTAKDGAPSGGEWIKVGTRVVSNQITQNPYLHGLFNWRQNKSNLPETLSKITFAGEEIVKFLKETFDAFFAILDDANGAAPHVFTALVDVIEMLVDEKKQRRNYRPILDNYINEHFRGMYAQQHLLACLAQYFADYENKRELIKTIKALEYVLKFIIQSRILLMSHGAVVDSNNFKAQLLDFFGKMNNLLKNDNKKFAGAQTTAIKKLAPLFDLLLKIFTPAELAGIVVDFLGAIPYDEQSKILNYEKLSLIETLVNGELFAVQEARDMLLHRIVTPLQLHLHLKVDEETPLVVSVLLALMENLQTRAAEAPYVELLVPMLPTLVNLVESSSNFNAAIAGGPEELIHYDVVMSLVGLYFFMGPNQFGAYIASLPDQASQQYFLQSTFDILQKFVNKTIPTFPDNWFVMHMCMFSTILKVIVVLAHFMQQRLDLIASEQGLWRSFFKLTLAYINSNVLELESFAETKKKVILERYGDMRMDVLQILQLMWQSLDHHQHSFLEDLVSPFFQLVALEQPILSDRGTDLYMTLLHREYQSEGGFKKVEALTIEMLDNVFYSILERARNDAKTEDERREYVRTWFRSKLSGKFDGASLTGTNSLSSSGDASGANGVLIGSNDATLNQMLVGFVGDMTHLLQLLYDFRVIPEDPAWEAERTIGTIRLMEYFRSTGRIDAYKRYVHALVAQHVASSSYVEAANTLLLHANLLQWDNVDDSEEAQGGFPKQSVSARKVALYRQAITYFDQGKMWEMCIKLINELRVVIERQLFDFAMLAELTSSQGQYYKNIVSTERFFCEYFRVGYYGRGFPVTLRNKEFVFRGLELERLTDFSQRVAAKFPEATLMKSTDPPTDEVLLSDGQHLQIFSVKPCSLAEKDGRPNPRVHKHMPANIAKYHIFNEVNCFLYSKPFRKNKQKGETQTQEFADLWYKNWYMVTDDSFPTVHTRSEVINKICLETTPVQNAVSMVQDKNREIQQVTAKQEAAGSTLTLVLKGVIDAAVNGGTALYTQAFLNDSYLTSHPGDIGLCEQLQSALEQQIPLLEDGLRVHGRMCSAEMAGLQEQLEMQLKTMTDQLRVSTATVLALFSRFQQYKNRPSISSIAGMKNPSNIIAPLPSAALGNGSTSSGSIDEYAALSSDQLVKLLGAMESKAEMCLAMISANADDLAIASYTGLSAPQIQQVRQYGNVDVTAIQAALQAKATSQREKRLVAAAPGITSLNAPSSPSIPTLHSQGHLYGSSGMNQSSNALKSPTLHHHAPVTPVSNPSAQALPQQPSAGANGTPRGASSGSFTVSSGSPLNSPHRPQVPVNPAVLSPQQPPVPQAHPAAQPPMPQNAISQVPTSPAPAAAPSGPLPQPVALQAQQPPQQTQMGTTQGGPPPRGPSASMLGNNFAGPKKAFGPKGPGAPGTPGSPQAAPSQPGANAGPYSPGQQGQVSPGGPKFGGPRPSNAPLPAPPGV